MVVAACALPGVATATVGNCGSGDAPNGYDTHTCHGVCTESGSELTCELETLCTGVGALATVVAGFGSPAAHQVSAWGNCFSGETFCCVFDEGATNVTEVELSGTGYVDESLMFVYAIGTGSEENLKPWDADPIHGFIRGNEGGDIIKGSNYQATDYDESLFGQDGNDVIDGNDGGDFISGGDHNDTLTGSGGNDILWGGDGDDDLYGMLGNDKLCDASGYDFCASDQGNFMDGGGGDDKLWYEESENPNVPCPGIRLDFNNSTAGPATDACGDNSNFTALELPVSCESYITTKPTACEGAN